MAPKFGVLDDEWPKEKGLAAVLPNVPDTPVAGVPKLKGFCAEDVFCVGVAPPKLKVTLLLLPLCPLLPLVAPPKLNPPPAVLFVVLEPNALLEGLFELFAPNKLGADDELTPNALLLLPFVAAALLCPNVRAGVALPPNENGFAPVVEF